MNQQNPVQRLMEEYAHLEHQASIHREFSQPVPPQILRKMEAIAAWGRANINPNSFHLAIKEVNQRVAVLQQQRLALSQELERAQGQSRNQAVLSDAVGRVTKGMLGQDKLTPGQLSSIVTKQPFRARLPNERLSPAQRDIGMRNATRALDPAGKGWTVAEFTKRMDELTDADGNEFAKLVRKYKVDPQEARTMANQWKTKRVEYGIKQRMVERHGEEKPGPIIREVGDSEHRKATLATAMLADANDQNERGDSRNLDGFLDRGAIHESYLEDTGRRGDIARSFEKLGYDG